MAEHRRCTPWLVRATTIALLISICLPLTEPKKVIYFPYFQTSHTLTFVKAAKALTKLGHESYVMMAESVSKKLINSTGAVKMITYGHGIDDFEAATLQETKLLDRYWFEGVEMMDVKSIYTTYKHILSLYNDIFTNGTFMTEIEDIQADLIVLDVVPFSKNSLVLPYKLNVPFLMLGNYYDYIGARIPVGGGLVPFPILTEPFSSDMPFLERFTLVTTHFLSYFYDPFFDSTLFEKVVPDKPVPSIWELAPKAEMYIFEMDHIMDYARPSLPNVRMIGGMSPIPAKPLQGSLKKFVENSPNGVAYVSFGTVGDHIADYMAQKLTDAFQKLPLNVVWRINRTSPDPERVMAVKWIAQNDMLGDKNMKVFVSHCGAWGQYEALYHGVPILCLPMCMDQFHNAHRITFKGYGLQADMRKLTSDELADLIMEVATNETFQKNVQRGSKLFRKFYKVPADEAAFWIDHVMEYGGSYMRFAGQDMPFYKFICLDIIAVYFLFVFCLVGFITFCCRSLYRRCSASPKKLKRS